MSLAGRQGALLASAKNKKFARGDYPFCFLAEAVSLELSYEKTVSAEFTHAFTHVVRLHKNQV